MAINPDEAVDPKTGQQSTLPYTPGGVNDDLMALIRQLEVPQPRPLTRTQDIGAGLMRIGSSLRGGPANIQSGAEVAYQRASEEATQANTATRRGLIGEEIRSRQEQQRQQAIADRQAADDARASAQKEKDRLYSEGKLAEDRKYQEDKSDREQRRTASLELIKTRKLKPGDLTDPANPPSWDIIIRAAAQPATPDLQAVDALRDVPTKAGERVSIQVPSTGEPTLQISPEPPGSGTKQPVDATSMATLLSNAHKTGEDFSGLVDDPKQKDVLKRVAAAGKKKLIVLPTPVQKTLADNLTGLALVDRMMGMLVREDGSDNDVFGPASTKVELTQGEERETFRKAAINMASAFMKSRSGTAVNEQEFQRLSKMLPDLNRMHLNNVTSLRELRNYFAINMTAHTPEGKEEAVEHLRAKVYAEQAKSFGLRPSDRIIPGIVLEDE